MLWRRDVLPGAARPSRAHARDRRAAPSLSEASLPSAASAPRQGNRGVEREDPRAGTCCGPTCSAGTCSAGSGVPRPSLFSEKRCRIGRTRLCHRSAADATPTTPPAAPPPSRAAPDALPAAQESRADATADHGRPARPNPPALLPPPSLPPHAALRCRGLCAPSPATSRESLESMDAGMTASRAASIASDRFEAHDWPSALSDPCESASRRCSTARRRSGELTAAPERRVRGGDTPTPGWPSRSRMGGKGLPSRRRVTSRGPAVCEQEKRHGLNMTQHDCRLLRIGAGAVAARMCGGVRLPGASQTTLAPPLTSTSRAPSRGAPAPPSRDLPHRRRSRPPHRAGLRRERPAPLPPWRHPSRDPPPLEPGFPSRRPASLLPPLQRRLRLPTSLRPLPGAPSWPSGCGTRWTLPHATSCSCAEREPMPRGPAGPRVACPAAGSTSERATTVPGLRRNSTASTDPAVRGLDRSARSGRMEVQAPREAAIASCLSRL